MGGDLGINTGEGVGAKDQGAGTPTPAPVTPVPGVKVDSSPGKDLSLSATDQVKAVEAFGKGGQTQQQLRMSQQGIAGTFQVTNKETLQAMADSAWELSLKTQKPVVVVVRAPRQAG